MNLAERIKARMKIGERRKVANLAKSFRVRRADVEECVWDTNGLDLLVAVRSGIGAAELPKSEWEIERYE